jgi:F-type H+-transporting ATPase subunit b
MRNALVVALVSLSSLLGGAVVSAAETEEHGHAEKAGAHEATEAGTHGEHGHGAHHVPTWDDINWFYGFLGESDDGEPSLLFRPKGMQAPFGAYLLNAALLYGVIYRYTKKPLKEALRARKANILRGMDEAARMKKDAEARLEEYEKKLDRIDSEIERVRTQMREAAQREREGVLADARARRERLERDARLLIDQELAATRDDMKRELVTQALASAADVLTKRLTDDDRRRLADEYLAGLSRSSAGLGARN